MKPDPEDTMMDNVQRWTFERHPGKEAAIATRYRVLLRQATRFKLSNDFVRMTCHTSHDLDRMEEMCVMARLPYDVMWIEFDLHAKSKEFHAMGSLRRLDLEQIPPRVGYLLALDKPSTSRWIATEFIPMGEEVQGELYRHFEAEGHGSVGMKPDIHNVFPQPCDLIFDPEGGYAEIVTGSTLWRAKTLSRIPELASSPAMLHSGDGRPDVPFRVPTDWPFFGVYDGSEMASDGPPRWEMPDWLPSKMGACKNAYWDARLTRTLRNGSDTKQAQEIYRIDARERQGALRFLVTVLAMIDAPPVKVFPADRREGSYMAGRTRQDYLNHSHITITVPKERALQQIGEYLKHESARRRRHKVRGHWRVIERGRKGPCNHRPTMVENGVGICLGCERLIRWIPWFMRGDASLGYVDQDYTVETH